jgi:hypothetical protein
VKGIFIDTNFYFLALTVFVAALHLLLDVLAFKNDISFWRNRKTMVGLSTRSPFHNNQSGGGACTFIAINDDFSPLQDVVVALLQSVDYLSLFAGRGDQSPRLDPGRIRRSRRILEGHQGVKGTHVKEHKNIPST